MNPESRVSRHITFEYLYRDTSNYKRYGRVVFRNPNRTSAADLDRAIRQILEPRSPFPDVLQFRAERVDLPTLFFAENDSRTMDDIDFHEFHSIEFSDTTDDRRDRRSIDEFLHALLFEAQRR
jgi:hypothetical protein